VKDTLFVALQFLLPQHWLSRLAGRLADCEVPWIKNPLIRAFTRHFEVDLSEAEQPDGTAYPSFNAFFTRPLKAGARPIAADGIACPADGAISQLGSITGSRIFQAKGRDYTTLELLGGDATLAERFDNGSFATIYLSPRDYHRVHMPLDGVLERTVHIPGHLFSVNRATAEGVPRLFARNERLVAMFDTPAGPMAMVLVGAMIVAGIDTVWAGQVAPAGRKPQHIAFGAAAQRVALVRGAEMGRFRLGSTVILLFPRGVASWDPALRAGSPVRMGQAMGSLAARP